MLILCTDLIAKILMMSIQRCLYAISTLTELKMSGD